jgi:hypothetical protein
MAVDLAVGSSAGPTGRAGRAALRTLGVAGVLACAAAVTLAAKWSVTASAISYLAKYSPDRFAHGRIASLPLSAFLLGHPHMIGPTTFFVVLIFLPYALWCGLVRAAIVGMSGHVVCTLVIALFVLPLSVVGWSTAVQIARSQDYGASAALAACAGGLVVALWRKLPVVSALVLLAVTGWFVYSLATIHQTMSNVADIEHLTALTTGIAVEWWLERRARRLPPAVVVPADVGA